MTDKCRRDRHRKLIRYRGVATGAATDEKSLFGVRRKSNDFRVGRGAASMRRVDVTNGTMCAQALEPRVASAGMSDLDNFSPVVHLHCCLAGF